MFAVRNKTHNGVERHLTENRAKAEAKAASLMAEFPGTEFEVVEMVAKAWKEVRYVPGAGRAGNSYPVKVRRVSYRPTP